MKVLIFKNSDLDIFTEDGGYASIYHNQENYLTLYYENRITPETDLEEMWEELGEGDSYCKEWPKEQNNEQERIDDALNWLIMLNDGFDITIIEGDIDNDKLKSFFNFNLQ